MAQTLQSVQCSSVQFVSSLDHTFETVKYRTLPAWSRESVLWLSIRHFCCRSLLNMLSILWWCVSSFSNRVNNTVVMHLSIAHSCSGCCCVGTFHWASIRWQAYKGLYTVFCASIHGTPNSVPEKCSHNLCIYYPSIERTRLFRGKGQFFWARKPGFNLDSGDTLALKKWLTTKRVDIFELMYSTHNYESFHKVNFLTWIDVMHLCEFSI